MELTSFSSIKLQLINQFSDDKGQALSKSLKEGNEEQFVTLLDRVSDQEFQECNLEELANISISTKQKKAVVALFHRMSFENQVEMLRRSIALDEDKIFIVLWNTACVAVRKSRDKQYGASLLQGAIMYGRNQIVTFLLNQGVDTQTLDNTGRTPYFWAKHSPCPVETRIVQFLKKKDLGCTKELRKCRLLGTRFSLQGPLFEGFHQNERPCLVKDFVRSIQEYSKTNSLSQGCFSQKNVSLLTDLFTSAIENTKELSASYEKTGMIALSGWARHAVAMVFYTNFCAVIDTGTGEQKGIHFFSMPKVELEKIQEVVKTLGSHWDHVISQEEGEKYLRKTAVEKLALQKIAFLEEEQESNNCVWMACKVGLLAYLVLQQIDTKNPDKKAVQKAYDEVGLQFSVWESEDKQKSLAAIFPLLIKQLGLADTRKVVEQLLDRLLDDRFRGQQIIQLLQYNPWLWSWQDPDTGKSLLRLTREKKDFLTFSYMLAWGGMSFLPEKEKQDFEKDRKENPLCLDEINWILTKSLRGFPPELIKNVSEYL